MGAAVGVAAVAAMLAGATSAAADPEARPETAFALAGQGVLNFGPLVKVAAPDGNPVHAELIGLSSVPGLSAAGFSGGLLTSDARAGYASTSVANLKLSALLSGDLIKTTCENGRGNVEIVNGSVLGTALPQFPITGQSIPLAPLATITLGEEKRNADGSITVTGIKVSVLPTGAPTASGVPGIPGLPGIGGANAPAVAVPVKPAFVTVDDEDGADDASDAESTPPEPSKVPPPPPTPPKVDPPAAPAVPGLPSLLSLPLPKLPTPGQPLQTITVGSATCGTVDDEHPRPGHDDGDGRGDDHDGGQHWSGDNDHDEPSSDDADDAPAPDVVEASLPVTG